MSQKTLRCGREVQIRSGNVLCITGHLCCLPEETVKRRGCVSFVCTIFGQCLAFCAQKLVKLFKWSVSYCCLILNKVGHQPQTSAKLTSIGFHENSLNSSWIVACYKRDRQALMANLMGRSFFAIFYFQRVRNIHPSIWLFCFQKVCHLLLL